ncbi:hypothetical protein ACES2L_04685 [Bdellovibrio bacteriovorus]
MKIVGMGLLLLLALLPNLSHAQSDRWVITKTEWTEQDEINFGAFITQIGQAVERRECLTVDACLKSPANPYVGTDPEDLELFADCADLPYYLRAYFAWKNGLPMSIQEGVKAREPNDNKDPRYTMYGNIPKGRFDIIPTRFKAPNAVRLLNNDIVDKTYSASFRMMGNEIPGVTYTDFYPVKLHRDAIRPGTVIYDPNGHVAIIHRITDDGHIYYIDSHPDNTITSGLYTPKFVRSFPFQGAGFKNFRPLALVGASKNFSGEYYGGKIVAATNAQLPHFSLEQFYGNQPDPAGDWKNGKFVFQGSTLGYYEYLRLMMASGDLQIDPLQDMRTILGDICTSLKDRAVAVDFARQKGIDQVPHPIRLPKNIYGTDGEWEAYATPARDARLKVAYMDLLFQAQQSILRYRARDPQIIYSGPNLAQDLLRIYQAEARACQFSYTNSAGIAVPLDLEMARIRLFDLSFDPYHCVELRWGANSAQELSTCLDDQNKRDWYAKEKWLRYQWERRYDARMDFSLEELDGPKPGAGLSRPPDVDIIRMLMSQRVKN